ncbi:MAG: nitroreductase [Alphaproteobacteria bacterium]|nr:nitroreductase [Alphaproteobacteria bacterium]
MKVEDAITSRRSVRAFLDRPVPRATVEHILRAAARAPSGTNMQPWRVWVVTGPAKARLSAAIHHARAVEPDKHDQEYRYYPPDWREPYLGRRRKIGWDLYGLLGIERGEKERMHAQHGRNFDFFDAPVGMIFTIDRDLEIGSWLDFGMFLQNIMLAARGEGLHTCPQAAFAPYHAVIRETLGVPDDQVVICGMSLGYEDEAAPENRLRTVRVEVDEFARFIED